MGVWTRWLVVIVGSLACFGACWAGLAVWQVFDAEVQIAIAAVPLVVALAILGAWAGRTREKASYGGAGQSMAIGQGAGGVVVGAGEVITFHLSDPPRQRGNGREGPLVVGEVPQEPVAFQGRPNLAEVLTPLDGTWVPVVFALTGIRGVGKTQAAAAYARQRIADGWRLVAWVDASDEASVVAGLAQVAVAAGVGPVGEDARTLATGVRHWLEVDGDRRLIVFDNAVDLDGLRLFLPAGGASQVVITSNRRSAAELGAQVPIEVFTEAEALAFLEERTGVDDSAGAAELAAELGYLPLGLAQAAALIAREHIGYRTYLDRLRALPVADYLSRTEGDAYPYRLAEAIVLSLRAVEVSDSAVLSRGLINVVALLSTAGVPRALLYAAGQQGLLSYPSTQTAGPQSTDAALGQLADVSLLTFSLDMTTVFAHRLVMRVAIERQVEDGSLAGIGSGVTRLLSTVAESLREPWRNRSSAREVIQQVAALHEHLQPYIGAREVDLVENLLKLRGWVIWCLNELGDSFDQAIDYGEPLVSDSERILGQTHSETLSARNNLAYAYQAAGRLENAILLYQGTLAVCERVLGESNPRTLAARSNVASAYLAAGRVADAVPLYEHTLADYERLLGADYPDTLRARSNLADAYRASGRSAAAIPLYERTLVDRERLLGADHPSTVGSRSNLALAYLEAGRVGEAIPLYEGALADYERLLGSDHPDTLSARNNLAYAYRAGGRLAEAIPLYELTLADRERILGETHPDTRGSLSNLAYAYRDAERFEEAEHLERALGSVGTQGEASSTTVRFRSNLASAYESVERRGEGIPLLERTLSDHKQNESAGRDATDIVAADSVLGIRPTATIPDDQQNIQEREQLIREISHSVNTPLAQIELAIREVAEGISDAAMIKALQRSEQSVQLCRAVLASYRDITAIAAVVSEWDVRDLRPALRSVVEVYMAQGLESEDNVRIEIDTPSVIVGYSNYMIISLLLPLLQNAVEAAPPRTLIRCWADWNARYYFFRISNAMRIRADLDMLKISNYTSKLGPHEGLGLSSVRTLLARQAHMGASLEFAIADNLFIATVRLPRRSGSDD
jgi:tetratricopeptide (TPR) repeat protein